MRNDTNYINDAKQSYFYMYKGRKNVQKFSRKQARLLVQILINSNPTHNYKTQNLKTIKY